MIKKRSAYLFLSLLLLLIAPPSFAQEPISKHWITGVTIDGHDTVAYHTPEAISKHKAVKGEKGFTVEWKGAVWRFSNAENRDAFLADPDKYSPEYGGHCANALSLGEGLVKTDGTHWEILEDQLYVFYAARGRDRWNDGNWKTYKVDADKAWQEILENQ